MLNLLYSVLFPFCALLYAKFYRATGRECVVSMGRQVLIRALFCFVLNCLLQAAGSEVFPFDRFWTLLLFLLTADIDILIQKIPTELLALMILSCFLNAAPTVPVVWSVLMIGGVCLAFSKKTGIALYDIILVTMMAMRCGDAVCALKFASLFLILWGSAGAGLRFIGKSSAPKEIPLLPAILTAYILALKLTPL